MDGTRIQEKSTMRRMSQKGEINLRCEQTETLLLMAVLGQGRMKETAMDELKRRKALIAHNEFDSSYATNLSGIC